MIDLKIRQKMRLNVLSVSSGSGVNLDYDPALPFEEGQTIMVLGSDNDLRKHLGLAYKLMTKGIVESFDSLLESLSSLI